MKKYAWTWNIKPEYLDEYVRMHLNPWPEILDAHTKAGFRNYSIFQNGCQFFYVFECEDAENAFAEMVDNEDCKRWNAITSKMIDKALDGSDVSSGVDYLREVFYLK